MWDFHLNYHEAEQIRAWVAELEQLDLGSIWVGEALFRDPFTSLESCCPRPPG